MDAQILHGRHYRTGEPILVHHEAGLISRIESGPAGSHPLPWIAPSLFDLQVNGFAGVDFQRNAFGTADLEAAARALARAGCGRFLLTLITDTWPTLLRRLERLRAARRESPLLQRMIAGWHIEGPFLSTEPGYCGAHDPARMLDPTPGLIEELRQQAGPDTLLLTLAPERPGALQAIRCAVQRGIKVGIGHTNATSETLAEALTAGASGFTHLGNACPQALDRHDNILFRVIDLFTQQPFARTHGTQPGPCLVSVIPDGIHVSPPLFRILHQMPWQGQLGYVSDAMAAADSPPGIVTLGSIQLEAGADGIVRQPGRSNFAGSALRPIDGVTRAAAMLGLSWRAIWDRFSILPAAWIGLPHGLEPGCPAHLCLLDECKDYAPAGIKGGSSLRVRTVLASGEELEQTVGDGGC